jgi:hypothetical protein
MSSEQAIRGALQTQLLTLGWDASRTAFEGKGFAPTQGVAYQEVATLFQTPFGRTHTGSSWAQGTFQIRVMWPLADVVANGIGSPTARAETIKAGFAMNLKLSGAGDQVVKVMAEPVITRGPPQGDRDVAVVRIRFADR